MDQMLNLVRGPNSFSGVLQNLCRVCGCMHSRFVNAGSGGDVHQRRNMANLQNCMAHVLSGGRGRGGQTSGRPNHIDMYCRKRHSHVVLMRRAKQYREIRINLIPPMDRINMRVLIG